jgi:hypothetical protein
MEAIEPTDTLAVSAAEWRAVRAAAAELDLVHGGYFRLRTAAVAFYCSPENHPAGWDLPFTDGCPETPRQFVGEVEVVTWSESDQVRLRIAVANWAGVQAIKRDYDRGRYQGRFQEYIRDQEEAFRGRSEDREWLRAQFHRLHRHALGALLDG